MVVVNILADEFVVDVLETIRVLEDIDVARQNVIDVPIIVPEDLGEESEQPASI